MQTEGPFELRSVFWSWFEVSEEIVESLYTFSGFDSVLEDFSIVFLAVIFEFICDLCGIVSGLVDETEDILDIEIEVHR